jgi:hypothetical protein
MGVFLGTGCKAGIGYGLLGWVAPRSIDIVEKIGIGGADFSASFSSCFF